jgi:hypothetical protein
MLGRVLLIGLCVASFCSAADVRSFGAAGDGTADDTAAIQKAVDSGDGVIDLPRGVYRITRTILVDLDKTGFTAFRGGGVARLVMAGPGPALKFLGTHLQGSADPNSFQPNVWLKQRMPVVDGVEFIGDHPDADAVQVEGTMQFTLTGCRMSQLRHGIHLVNRNRNLTISHCHIYHNRGIGVYYDNLSLHQSNIVGCHISYCGGGGIVFKGGDVRNVHIGTCDLESNHSPQGLPTANILIDCSGSANGTAEVAITGCTIQHNSVSPDSANIRILGRGDRGGAGQAQWGHVAITGNVLSDVATNIHLAGCRDVTITGNTFWMGFAHNLLVEDCAAIVVGPNAMDRNPAYAYGKSATASNAIVFRNSRDCTVTGLHVQGVHSAEAGVVFDQCDRFNITNCTILDNDKAGLLLRRLTRSRVSDCLIRDDRPDASSASILLTGGADNVLRGNTHNRPATIDPSAAKVD